MCFVCSGGNGQLGYGSTTSYTSPGATPGSVTLGTTSFQLALGGYHTCFVNGAGAVKCWGKCVDYRILVLLLHTLSWHICHCRGDNGRLGYGGTTQFTSPGAVSFVNLGGPVKTVVAAMDHTCAIYHNLTMRCWGR